MLKSNILSIAACATFVLTVSPATADHYAPEELLEELLVVGKYDRRQIDVADTVGIKPDSAVLVRRAPGANVNGNGPLTGIPQYRGMYLSLIHI